MPAFNVSKTIRIQASPEKVYSIISDFHHWPAWSPWLIAEPDAKVEIQADGKAYSWQGKRTGSGDMKVLNENAPLRLDMVVRFLKPWKSTSPVWFELKQQGQETDVTWHMDGSLPFFLFFMTRMMTAYIGMDYQRGLLMLKDYVETGAVPSQLKFDGIRSYAGCTFVGIKAECSMETVGQKMADDFGKLSVWVSQNGQFLAGQGFSIYHTWDVVKNRVAYTAAFPVKEVPKDLPAGFINGKIPATKVNVVAHTGPYKHLGNAWSTQYMMQRGKEYKYRKGIDPFEVYMNMPGQVTDDKLITEVYFPVV